jgi:hypothetical protein
VRKYVIVILCALLSCCSWPERPAAGCVVKSISVEEGDDQAPITYLSHCDFSTGYVDFMKSTNQGASWETATFSQAGPGNPTFFLKSGDLVRYFLNSNGLKMAQSVDGGVSWSHFTNLPLFGSTCPLACFEEDGSIYLAWSDGPGGALRFCMSTNGGSDYGANVKIADIDSDAWVTMYRYADKLYVFFVLLGGSYNGVCFLCISDNDGASWVVKSLPGSYNTTCPSMVVTPRGVCLALDNVGGFLLSTDDGDTWSGISPIDPAALTYGTDLVANGNELAVSYFDARLKTLKLARSSTNGSTWTPETLAQLDTTWSGGSSRTEMVISEGNYYIRYWQDSTFAPKLFVK